MGKELVKCKNGANNVGDPFAIAVVKSGVPRQISTTYSVSLREKKRYHLVFHRSIGTLAQ